MSTQTNLHYTQALRAATSRHGFAMGLVVFILSVVRVHG